MNDVPNPVTKDTGTLGTHDVAGCQTSVIDQNAWQRVRIQRLAAV